MNNFTPCVSSSDKIRLPWWTPEYSAVSRAKKWANRLWLGSWFRMNRIEHKRASVVPRRTLCYTRGSSGRRYVSFLRMDVSPSVMWSRVRKISRRYAGRPVMHFIPQRSLLLYPSLMSGEVPESYNIPPMPFADGLSYPFLRHLHSTTIEFLLSFFNCIYKSEKYSDIWHLPIVIRIPKLNKD